MSAVQAAWLRDDELDEWAGFVASSPTGSPYSLPAYLRALCRATGARFRVLGARLGDDLVGGIAVYERPTRLGVVVAPRLLLYYNGLVLREETTRYPSERTSRELRTVEALLDALEGEGYRRLELRSRPPLRDGRAFSARGWSLAPSWTYVVPLEDLGAQWDRVEGNLRRLVRRCERDGFTVTQDDDFDALYDLHAGIHDRTGAALYLPRDAFRAFYEELRAVGLCALYHARAPGGEVGASQLVLLGHPVAHTVAAGTDPRHAKAGAAPFLRWRALEDLAARGHVGNDLTDASLASVARFKAALGAELDLSLVAVRSGAVDRTAGAVRAAALSARDGARRMRGS
ncbi:MAG TPA: GNAT family N-acetyltransferase [Gaiellaceae bacterium]|nr:GNAT family N-acetyltransferase [Gaiellaceae bacterium]